MMVGTGQEQKPGRMLTSDLLLGLDDMALFLFPQSRADLAGVFSQLPWQALPFSEESGLIPLTPCQLLIPTWPGQPQCMGQLYFLG